MRPRPGWLTAQADGRGTLALLRRGQLGDVRAANRALLLALAQELRAVSCPALAKRSGLSRATAYAIAEELQRSGVLVDGGVGPSSGGRRPQLLHFEPRAWCAVGIEMGERDLHAVLTDLDGTVLHRDSSEAPGMTPAQVVEATATSVARLLAAAPQQRLLGVGFAAPGLVDMEQSIVRTAVTYDWTDVPLAALLQERTGLPVYVANRAKAAALGEWYSGAGVGARHLVYLYAGRGIAAGVILDGDLYTGSNSSAGELGHITIIPDGMLCECGNHGCLHTVASGAALVARARAELRAREQEGAALRARCGHDPARLTTADLAAAAHNGDPIATLLVQEGARYLGIAAATIIDLLNPDRILLGGPLAGAGPLFLEAVRGESRRRALAAPFGAAQICPAALGDDAGSIGAAAMVLRRASDLIAAATSGGTRCA